MSDSRLEKFIYAICSMDVSALPVPLSRIEKLWNCLITGETPDFEPLSRNEKYLMAMLDRYDISNLPAPMSRGEKLLYKIAVGETDLSDVPGYYSRYEELLKYLIENGGISGGDFEYVLYTINQSLSTLYTTAEKPVKSAILSGQTLNNIALTINNVIHKNAGIVVTKPSLYDMAKRYIVMFDVVEKPDTLYMKLEGATGGTWKCDLSSQKLIDSVGRYYLISNVSSVQHKQIKLTNTLSSSERCIVTNVNVIEYQNGMENWDIPHFEGMQSVKMPVLTTTGKNLFPNIKFIYRRTLLEDSGNIIDAISDDWACDDYLEVPTQKTMYTNMNYIGLKWTKVCFYDENKNYISPLINDDTINFPENAKYWRVGAYADPQYGDLFNQVMFCKSLEEAHSTYEPYKTNILTVNEDVTLRSNGNFCDELNLLTGQLTQRIGEDGVVLSQEVVKTVDLTVVDQDNQPTQLGTFENVTHVSLEAENLIPTLAMEVATRISNELASASPLMDDISIEQEQLNTTVNEQSNNVDATMIATTEIYEETL